MKLTPATILAALAVIATTRAQEASPWKRAVVPGFTIYADVPEAATQTLLHDFLVVNRDFRGVWAPPERVGAPGVVILCNTPAEYARFSPPGRAPSPSTSDRWNIVINFRYRVQSLVIADGYPPMVEYFGDNLLQRVYGKYFLGLVGERVPPWLEQGLGKLLQGMYCTDAGIEFQPLTTDPTLAVRLREHGSEASLQAALKNGSFQTLERLFAESSPPKPSRSRLSQGRNGVYLVGPSNRGFWSMLPFGPFVDESYEFAQFCLFGEAGKYRAAFIKFAAATSNGPLDEAGFQNFFGADYHTMLLALWRYTGFGQDRIARSSPGPLPAVRFEPAASADIARLESEWASGHGVPEDE